MKRLLLTLICLAGFDLAIRAQDITSLEKIGPATSFTRSDRGVTFTCRDQSQVQLTVLAPDLIRVRVSFTKAIPVGDHSWAIAREHWETPRWGLKENGESVTISTDEMEAVVRRSPLLIEFRDAHSHELINADEQ